MTDHAPIRVGIVGLGGIARGQHIPGYALCENVELAAFCDTDRQVLDTMADRHGVARRTTDYGELVAYDDLDAISVCTWPNTHHRVAMAALAKKLHVYCEKPLALTYPLAREMWAAAKQARLVTACGFTHRLTPAAHLAHNLIADGALGEIYQISAVYSMGAPGWADQPLTLRRTRAVTGGGHLFEMGPHMVDMVRWWTGKEITAVCAQNRTFVKRRPWALTGEMVDVDVEDASTFLADLEGETTAVFSHSAVVTGRNFDQRVEVYGSEGALLYDQARPYELRACLGATMADLCAGYGLYDPMWGRTRQEEPYPVIPVPRSYLSAVPGEAQGRPLRTFAPAFIDAIRGNPSPLLPTFYEGMRAQAVLDAVLRSAEERRWVDVEEN